MGFLSSCAYTINDGKMALATTCAGDAWRDRWLVSGAAPMPHDALGRLLPNGEAALTAIEGACHKQSAARLIVRPHHHEGRDLPFVSHGYFLPLSW